MKSKKIIHSKVRTRLVSIAVCFALLVTVLSFGFFNAGAMSTGSASADNDPRANEVGVRFVQIAAGVDFAIGLTYDGQLYGWSTLETGAGSSSPNSLGTYYTKDPKKITVNFKNGPNTSQKYGWGNSSYHNKSSRSERIIQIAATRTTAAFVTNFGYIYTWGNDTMDVTHKQSAAMGGHMLLLRNCSSSDSAKANYQYEPYIINYGYYSKTPGPGGTGTDSSSYSLLPDDISGLTQIIPGNASTPDMQNISIAGGEYNYSFMFTRSGVSYVYMWGSMLYENKIIQSDEAFKRYDTDSARNDIMDDSVERYVYKLPYSGTGKVVAGGYTMGINLVPSTNDSRTAHTTSLMLRGKNFITTAPVKATGTDGHYAPVNTVKTPSPGDEYYAIYEDTKVGKGGNDIVYGNGASSGNTYEQAIIGGRMEKKDGNYTVPSSFGNGVYINNDLAFGRQVVNTDASGNDIGENFDYAIIDGFDQFIYDSYGNRLNDDGVNGVTLKIVPDAVSLGNDIGYGISGGTLYAWGDNAYGQNGAGASDSKAYRDIPDAVITGNVFDVAAGKQLSGAQRAFYHTSNPSGEGGTFSSTNSLAFNDTVKNQPDYITGILKSTNPLERDESELWVWSNNSPEPTRIYYGGLTDGNNVNYYNQFVKLYSGYGNKLFAITRLGQAVMIEYKNGGYKQTIYDKFNDGNGVYDNWKVAAETNYNAANFVSFEGGAAGTSADPLPELGIYTITVNDGGVKSVDAINLNRGNSKYSDNRNSLVTENKAGNVYRILNPDVDTSDIVLIPTTSNGLEAVQEGFADTTKFLPKFYWTAHDVPFNRANDLLSEDKVDIISVADGWTRVGNMFEYKFENVKANPNDEQGDPNNTGLMIKPLQSTKGGKIKIEFYVGRYATTGVGATTGGNSHANEKQLFFDYKACSFDFDVLNTPAYKNYSAFDASGYANIPLLDPNNPANDAFSLAVQDASGGIDKLVEQFFNNDAALKNAIYEDIKTEDSKGFPDSSRIESGRLDYYLNAADQAKYNNSYNYLFSDRDADRLVISSRNAEIPAEAGRGVTSEKDTIDVSVDLDSITSDEQLAQLKKDITYKFDNKYGLYDIKLEKKNDKYTLDFKFDIIRFVANGSTGTLKYKPENGVSDYMTTNHADNGYAEFSYDFDEYYEYNSGFVVDTGMLCATGNEAGGRIVRAFSQPSLIASYNNVTYYGKNDGENRFTVTYPSAPNMVIGKESEPFVINLTQFIARPGDYIMFSYDDSNTKYSEFNSQFPDETGTVASTVQLTKNQIRVTPMSTHALKFSVAIQRFHTDDAAKASFSEDADRFAGGNEKIIITFDFPSFKDFRFEWKSNVKAPTLTSDGIIDLLAKDPAAVNTTSFINVESGDDFAKRIYISQLQSSNTDVLTVQAINTPEQTTKFRFATLGSGNTVVTFVLSLYDKSILCSLPLSVSAITHISDTIELVDISYIYVNSMITELRRANSSFDGINNYGILYNDPKAVYFTDSTGAVVAKPEYIQSVTFLDTDPSLSNPRMRIEINNGANDMSGKYGLHVRYVDSTYGFSTYDQAEESNVPILETSQEITSSRRIVPGDDGDSILTIRIDTDDLSEHRSSSGSEKLKWFAVGDGNDVEIRIPSSYILSKCNITSVEDFQIFLVSAPTEAAEYFNYGYSGARDYVTIRPQKNTPVNEFGESEAISINVSVNSTAGTSGKDTRYIMSLRIVVTGISETLSKERYTMIWLVAFFSSLGFLMIIFIIRMIVYWRRRAKQRALIKRNQELIKMRDRIHNKSSAATREQIVRSKLKMQDPRYAKMVNDMRKERQGVDSGGAVVENSGLAFSEPGGKGKKDKKKKSGKKKSIAELKAELEAKKVAFAQAQNAEPQPPFAGDMGGMPVDGQPFDMSTPAFDMGDPGFGSPADAFSAQDLDANSIIFDAADDNGQV